MFYHGSIKSVCSIEVSLDRIICTNTIACFTGVERQCDVCFCTCTDDAVVLIKHGLWPVSPKAPKAAIEEELMELLECLLLESHISLNSFYNALKWKSVINMKLTFVSINVHFSCTMYHEKFCD